MPERDQAVFAESRGGAPYSRTPADLPPGDSPPAQQVSAPAESDDKPADPAHKDDAWLLQKAQEIYTSSTNYLETNIATTWERSLAHFRSQHAAGTAYRTQSFRRSRVFRPKTRGSVKAKEAAIAAATFATTDLLDVQPENQKDETAILSAQVNKALVQWRLTNTVPWFLTVVGAFQDTMNYGICISHQYWEYLEDTDIVPVFNDDGSPLLDEEGAALGREETIIRQDRPCCDNVPPENFRFDAMCDWRDPAATSPYIVYLKPIYIDDAFEMMEKVDPKTGQSAWRKYDRAALLATKRQDVDRTKQAREGEDRSNPADNKADAFTTLWSHLNVIRVNGEDMAYWTMGTQLVLTDIEPLTTMYPHLKRGVRPFTIGYSSIEAHRNYPAGDNEQAAGLQEEINTVANQRLDNVKLVLNKRYFVRRGSMVDLDSLIRNVPGGGVMMNDPEKDVNVVNTSDVTSSSYEEQDRLSTEMDELVGHFSQSSVSQNRQLNETVGGMSMMSQGASAITDYSIRIFMETWMEPVLRQMVLLEQKYETDEVVLALAAEKSELWTRFGINEVTDSLLQQNLVVGVNIGIGNTDPVRRVERLVFGVEKVAQLPGMVDRVKSQKVSDEIFGALGYKDSSRFFKTDEETAAEEKEPPIPPEIQVKLQELQIRREDNVMRDKREIAKLEADIHIREKDLALKYEITMDDMAMKLGIASQKSKDLRDTTAIREINKTAELNMKRAQGSGI